MCYWSMRLVAICCQKRRLSLHFISKPAKALIPSGIIMPRAGKPVPSPRHFGELVGEGVDYEFQAIGDAELCVD